MGWYQWIIFTFQIYDKFTWQRFSAEHLTRQLLGQISKNTHLHELLLQQQNLLVRRARCLSWYLKTVKKPYRIALASACIFAITCNIKVSRAGMLVDLYHCTSIPGRLEISTGNYEWASGFVDAWMLKTPTI